MNLTNWNGNIPFIFSPRGKNVFQQLEDNFRQRFSYSKFFWKNKLENTRFNLSVIKRFVHQNNFLYSFPDSDSELNF